MEEAIIRAERGGPTSILKNKKKQSSRNIRISILIANKVLKK